MILLNTEAKGWLSGVTLNAILATEYGLMAHYVQWEGSQEDGIEAVVCFKRKPRLGHGTEYDVVDTVYEMVVTETAPVRSEKPRWA